MWIGHTLYRELSLMAPLVNGHTLYGEFLWGGYLFLWFYDSWNSYGYMGLQHHIFLLHHSQIEYLFTSKGLNPMDAMLLTWTLCSCLILHSCYEFFLKEESEVRFSAIRWATTLYGTQHCPSRYICMTGASDMKLDIRLVTKDLSWHDTFLHLYYKGHPS